MAKPEQLPNRKQYACSGQVNWSKAPAFLLVNFIGCLLGGWLMAFLFRHGFYLVAIVSVIFGMGAAGLTILAIKQTHCRSRFLGMLLGAGAGLTMFLGYYYFDFCHQLGAVAPVTELPAYIWKYRLKYDVIQDTHTPEKSDAGRPTPGRFFANLAAFLLELGLITGIPLAGGYRRAGKPYCEHCRQWMDRDVTHFDPAQTQSLLEALRSGSPASLGALCATADFATVPNLSLALDVCPTLKKDALQPCVAFLSVKRVEQNPQGAHFDSFDSSKGTLLIQAAQVSPAELPALAGRFPYLKSNSGAPASPVLPPVLPTTATAQPAPPAACVETKALPAEFSGQILSRKNNVTAFVVSIVWAIFMLGGMAIGFAGAFLAFPDKVPVGGVSPLAKNLGIFLMCAGFTSSITLLGINLANPTLSSNWWRRRVAYRALKSRPANLVNPDAPEAHFVAIIPKLNWAKMMLDDATEAGFLVVDKQRRVVLFEGDRECFRIPAQAITSCFMELHVQNHGNHQTTSYYAVLRANHPSGFWEAPLKLRSGKGIFSSGQRKRATEQLVREINSLRDPATLPIGHLDAQIGYLAG